MQFFNKWTVLRQELAEYMTNNRISENDFRFLGIYEWKNVYNKVLNHFVDCKVCIGKIYKTDLKKILI